MKNLIHSVLLCITLRGCAYLMGSFTSATFDIAMWDPFLRGFVGFIGGAGGVLAGLSYYEFANKEK